MFSTNRRRRTDRRSTRAGPRAAAIIACMSFPPIGGGGRTGVLRGRVHEQRQRDTRPRQEEKGRHCGQSLQGGQGRGSVSLFVVFFRIRIHTKILSCGKVNSQWAQFGRVPKEYGEYHDVIISIILTVFLLELLYLRKRFSSWLANMVPTVYIICLRVHIVY
jgi:hypothetical protein